ncbi:thymidylate kinase [Bacteroidota bacterium]
MLIVLEGLDGAGKSTQISMLQEFFGERGARVKYLHFPRFDAPVFGDLIARFLRGDLGKIDEVHPMLVALLFAGDRRDAAHEIKEWLSEGYNVILDRYLYSNIAFQCAKCTSDERAKELRDWIFDTEYVKFGIPVPDLNLFLDVPLNFVDKKLKENREGEERSYLMGKKDIHEESIAFQKRVREIYIRECDNGNDLKRVDCSGDNGEILPASEIFNKIKCLI